MNYVFDSGNIRDLRVLRLIEAVSGAAWPGLWLSFDLFLAILETFIREDNNCFINLCNVAVY